MSQQKYRVVVGEYEEVIEIVNNYLDEGYQCLGGTSVIPDEDGEHRYVQALTLKEGVQDDT